MSQFRTDSILPDPPDGAIPIVHNREYRVQAYRLAAERLLIQGAVRDQKPPGLYIEDDPEPITVHHMQLSLTVELPALDIVEVDTHFESFPMAHCPSIISRYGELVGVSIARGFTRRVKELFGGPLGCTHTTALLNAMAPVAVQSLWSMHIVDAREQGLRTPFFSDEPMAHDMWRRNVDTCHIWAADGEEVAARQSGAPSELPVFLSRRLGELGRERP